MSDGAETDWRRIELDYVLGGDEVTFRRLAAEHGVPELLIEERSSADGWPAKRAAHRSATAQSSADAERRVQETLQEWAWQRLEALQGAVMSYLGRLQDAQPGRSCLAEAETLAVLTRTLHEELDRAGSVFGKAEVVERKDPRAWLDEQLAELYRSGVLEPPRPGEPDAGKGWETSFSTPPPCR